MNMKQLQMAAILGLLITGCVNKGLKTPTASGHGKSQEAQSRWPEISPPQSSAKSIPKNVAVIIGPGGAKTLAAAGVLKELERARIPIHQIVGLEWGALTAGLFAQRGQVHDVDWKLYKLEKQDLPTKGLFSDRPKAISIKTLKPYLDDSFSRQDVGRAQVEFSCPTTEGMAWAWQERGDIAGMVQSCLAAPPLFLNEGGRYAGVFATAAAIERVRKKGAEIVILINVLNEGTWADAGQLPDSPSSVILWKEIRRSLKVAGAQIDDWIEVDTSAFQLGDFKHRRELSEAGEKAGRGAASRLVSKYGF
jgi:predicted acylesterase/phospholipase RssA